MKSLLIRDLPEDTIASLKNLARRHHRSLQGELHFILERASNLDREDSVHEELELYTVHSNSDSSWDRESLYNDDAR